jgi:hypothetical protein
VQVAEDDELICSSSHDWPENTLWLWGMPLNPDAVDAVAYDDFPPSNSLFRVLWPEPVTLQPWLLRREALVSVYVCTV